MLESLSPLTRNTLHSQTKTLKTKVQSKEYTLKALDIITKTLDEPRFRGNRKPFAKLLHPNLKIETRIE